MDNKEIEKAVLEQTARALKRVLTPEEEREVLLWHRGKSLRELTLFHGWSILKDMGDDYVEDARKDYDKTLDKDPDKITPQQLKDAHAVAFAIKRVFEILFQDVDSAVEFSNTPPEVVRLAAKQLARSTEVVQKL